MKVFLLRTKAMSRGPGRVQKAILETLRSRGGGEIVSAHYEPQVRLAPGIHDLRQIARELNTDRRGFSDARKQAAFSRAVATMVSDGILKVYESLVPIAEYWPERAWSHRVLELSDGIYLNLPPGKKWQRRFVSMVDGQL